MAGIEPPFPFLCQASLANTGAANLMPVTVSCLANLERVSSHKRRIAKS